MVGPGEEPEPGDVSVGGDGGCAGNAFGIIVCVGVNVGESVTPIVSATLITVDVGICGESVTPIVSATLITVDVGDETSLHPVVRFPRATIAAAITSTNNLILISDSSQYCLPMYSPENH
ncbi:hypothetical protein ACFLVN_02570 [Chloroflexota bacterium]